MYISIKMHIITMRCNASTDISCRHVSVSVTHWYCIKAIPPCDRHKTTAQIELIFAYKFPSPMLHCVLAN